MSRIAPEGPWIRVDNHIFIKTGKCNKYEQWQTLCNASLLTYS